MHEITFFHIVGEITVGILAFVLLMMMVGGCSKPKPKPRQPAPEAPPQRRGKILRREIIEGIEGMCDSYVAEIRDYGDDIRLLIIDNCQNLVVEARAARMKEFANMIIDFNHEYKERMKTEIREGTTK